MEEYARHKLIYKLLTPLGRTFLKLRYGMEFELMELKEPSILICNHVTNFDPIYLACCLKDSHTYFVASEHLERMGKITKILQYLTSFIPQKKGNSAMSTVKACVRHTKAGHSVAIFAEGNTTWDGITDHIFPATGKLVKLSGVPLVTFRLEGAYLSSPRWRKGIRRGRLKIHPIRTYSPKEIKEMSFDQVNEAIERDIHTNIWEQQMEKPVAYSGNKRAEGMERAIFMCPKCHEIGKLRSHGNVITCQCGFEREMDIYGYFTEKEPFPTIHEWDVWQKEELKNLTEVNSEAKDSVDEQKWSAARALASEDVTSQKPLFSDSEVTLFKITSDHEMSQLTTGTITQFEKKLVVGEHIFPMDQMEGMAIVNTKRLLFTCDKVYYEVRGQADFCARKYFLYQQNHR